jgi:hypothetical protein
MQTRLFSTCVFHQLCGVQPLFVRRVMRRETQLCVCTLALHRSLAILATCCFVGSVIALAKPEKICDWLKNCSGFSNVWCTRVPFSSHMKSRRIAAKKSYRWMDEKLRQQKCVVRMPLVSINSENWRLMLQFSPSQLQALIRDGYNRPNCKRWRQDIILQIIPWTRRAPTTTCLLVQLPSGSWRFTSC